MRHILLRSFATFVSLSAAAACFQDFEQFRGSSGGAGPGGSGGGVTCPTSCDDGNPCTTDTCENGVCENLPGVATLPDPPDCKNQICQNGMLVEENDDTEIPPDTDPCTNFVCVGGMQMPNYEPTNTPCNMTGFCDGMGNCSVCNTPRQCGMDTACGTRTCINSMCGWMYAAAGTLVSGGSDGNCMAELCTGSSETPMTMAYDLDLPVDGNACTNDVCMAGVPSNPAIGDGTACDDGGAPAGGQCLGANCVDCTTVAGCPGGDVCVANACCTPDGQATACAGKECDTAPQGCGLPDHNCGTCVAPQPFCNTTTDQCVECTADANCAADPQGADCLPSQVCGCDADADCTGLPATPACDTVGGACVECVDNGDCSAPTPFCNTSTNNCVECTTDAQCASDPTGHDCINNVCMCNMDSDCTGSPNGDDCISGSCGCNMANDCSGSPLGDECPGGGPTCGCVNDGDCVAPAICVGAPDGVCT